MHDKNFYLKIPREKKRFEHENRGIMFFFDEIKFLPFVYIRRLNPPFNKWLDSELKMHINYWQL